MLKTNNLLRFLLLFGCNGIPKRPVAASNISLRVPVRPRSLTGKINEVDTDPLLLSKELFKKENMRDDVCSLLTWNDEALTFPLVVVISRSDCGKVDILVMFPTPFETRLTQNQ